MTATRKCDVCGKVVPREGMSRIGIDDGQGDVGDEMLVCDSCFVAGVAEGFLDLPPSVSSPAFSVRAPDEEAK